MKKYLILLGALVCFSAQADVCCTAGSEQACCQSQGGKKYCANDHSCRTKCTNELCPEGYTYSYDSATGKGSCEENS